MCHRHWISPILLSLLLSACYFAKAPFGDTTIEPPLPSESVEFPHKIGWARPENHGTHVAEKMQFQIAPCLKCHQEASSGEQGPSCTACHAYYPHATGWALPTAHGAFVQSNGSLKCATQCHGSDLQGGTSKVNCNACHAVWPHPKDDWVKTAAHGEQSRLLGAAACTGCHDPIDEPDQKKGDCTTCHPSLPKHWDDDWKKSHGTYVSATGVIATDECTDCHGSDLQGGTVSSESGLAPEPSCSQCHASYPHVSGWKDFAGHGAIMLAKTESLTDQYAECQLCHGEALDGGSSQTSCFSCHTTFPHLHGWKELHGALYVTKENPQSSSCAAANCHGVNLEGNPGNVPPAEQMVYGCNDCHLNYPHQQGWTATHGASATLKDAVGAMVGLDACAACHGADLKGEDAASSCYTSACHTNFPEPHVMLSDGLANTHWHLNVDGLGHGKSVWDAAAGATKGKLAADKAGCAVCHANQVNGAVDWSTGGITQKDCYACHMSYPHVPPISSVGIAFQENAWGGPAGHKMFLEKKTVLLGVNEQVLMQTCGECHARTKDDVKAWSQAPACASCHDPHGHYPHPSGWLDPTHEFGGSHGDAMVWPKKSSASSQCLTACHGKDAKGGFVGPEGSCQNAACHPAYPHETVTNWLVAEGYNAHALMVLDTKATETREDDLFNDATFNVQCQGCHGDVLAWTKNDENMSQSQLFVLNANGSTHNYRCYVCHRYPHKTYDGILGWGSDHSIDGKDWGHYVAVIDWGGLGGMDKADVPAKQAWLKQTCGSTNDAGAGCHVDAQGPKGKFFNYSDPMFDTCTSTCHNDPAVP